MAVDGGLIAFSVIIPFVLIGFNLVVMARYIDPQAAAGHFIAKLMILLGMLMAECTVLLLPLDVGNKTGAVGCGVWNNNCGGLNMAMAWQIAYCIIAVLVVIVMPFFIFYYENDDEGMEAREKAEGFMSSMSLRFAAFKRSFCVACCSTLVVFAFCVILFFILYHYFARTKIPYKLISVSIDTNTFAPVGTPYAAIVCSPSAPTGSTCTCPPGQLCPCGLGRSCSAVNAILTMDVTFVIYLAALLSFVGWFLFSVYVGIGFIALPMDLIHAYVHRPRMLSVSEARAQRKALMKRAEELIKVGEEMANRLIEGTGDARNKSSRRKVFKGHKVELNRYKLLVDMLEKDLDEFQLGDPENYRQHYNPLVPYFKLLAGCASVIITVVWLIQIIVYMLFNPPLIGFMNTYLLQLDGFFPLFGTLTVAIFGLYLLLAAAKGAAKFGTRFFLITVHPLEPGKTLINSFMFNVQLVLLCVLPTIQFCTDAFAGYAHNSEADVIFGSQMRFIEGFRFFWQYNVFIFAILGFTLLSIIYFSIFPSDRKHLAKVMAQIKSKKAKEMKAFERKLEQQGGALSMV